MNLQKFASAKHLNDIGYAEIFMAMVSNNGAFYATKGFVTNDDGTQTDFIICLGPPLDLPDTVRGPCIYQTRVIGNDPVLDVNSLVQIVPAISSENVRSLNYERPAHGNIIFVHDNRYLTVNTQDMRRGLCYLDLDTGEITYRLDQNYGYIVGQWEIVTLDENNPQTVLAFPWIPRQSARAA